jgi:hypothetical protein
MVSCSRRVCFACFDYLALIHSDVRGFQLSVGLEVLGSFLVWCGAAEIRLSLGTDFRSEF